MFIVYIIHTLKIELCELIFLFNLFENKEFIEKVPAKNMFRNIFIFFEKINK
jgi:hypothetical protein